MADASKTPISPVTVSKPELTISSPAVNEEPVELDGTPTSPETAKTDATANVKPEEKEKRTKLIADRQKNPAVLVDLPQAPNSEEFGRSEDAEAKVSDKTAANKTA